LPQICHNIAKRLPFIWKEYYENVHERQTWKMEQNKKTSGIPFTLEKFQESADDKNE
jgi:hypothetical protein